MSKSSEKFVVIGVREDGGGTATSLRVVSSYANPLSFNAPDIETAIKEHRQTLRGESGPYTIYALPLADFIKHATPEKRDYRVIRTTTEQVFVNGCADEQEAYDRARASEAIIVDRSVTVSKAEVVR